jgi:hypothetical protein
LKTLTVCSPSATRLSAAMSPFLPGDRDADQVLRLERRDPAARGAVVGGDHRVDLVAGPGQDLLHVVLRHLGPPALGVLLADDLDLPALDRGAEHLELSLGGAPTSSRRLPDGSVAFELARGGALLRYRFGTETADFLVCARCGCLAGALSWIDRRPFAVLNAAPFVERQAITPAAIDASGESARSRAARRARTWTPVTHLPG